MKSPDARSPVAALKARVSEIDHAVFDKARLPTVAEWSEVAEMVGKLDMPAGEVLALPAPARPDNLIRVDFKRRVRLA
ncbi:MAG: hypothetical protein K2X91_13310 [Thermoleophilia bacterium]|nr:hypothetical protein [Thermoleophilia bacterium]